MSGLDALHAQILIRPGDDELRRQLAAALAPHDPAHAELIEVQLELEAALRAGTASAGALATLEAREATLVARGAATWAAPVAGLVDGYRLRRGLVSEVTVAADRVLDVAPALFAAAPVEHLTLTAPRTRLREVLAAPWLGRLASLSLARLGLGDADAIAVAAARPLNGLAYLSLAKNQIGPAGVEALAASPWLAGLEVLDLTGNPCDPTPRPTGYDVDGRAYAVERPALADALEQRHGRRPWLTSPTVDELAGWPRPRCTYRRNG